ncbi:unnamed protein product [Lathyrus sativus]|nr:unnamed protein product [Lathyrus sativus]
MDAKGMFEVFKLYGLVSKVFIATRLDKKGRRYDFVRFRKVNDERILAVKLDNIQIQGRKLHTNVPRFQRTTSVKKDQGGHKGGFGVAATTMI